MIPLLQNLRTVTSLTENASYSVVWSIDDFRRAVPVRNDSQTGSASIFSIAILLPLICIITIFGLELAGYFSALSRNQEVVDEAARIGTRLGGSSRIAADAAQRYIRTSLPENANRQVRIESSGSFMRVIIEEQLELPMLNLMQQLAGSRSSTSILSSSRGGVRRFPFDNMVLLDVVQGADNLCSNDTAKAAFTLADRMGPALFEGSNRRPDLFVQPGSDNPIESVSGSLCTGSDSPSCVNNEWIPFGTFCTRDFLAARPSSSDGLRGLLRHLVSHEEFAVRENYAANLPSNRAVFRVSWLDSATAPISGIDPLVGEVNELRAYLRGRHGRVDIVDVEVRPSTELLDYSNSLLELRDESGVTRRMIVSRDDASSTLATRLASLRRREVISQ